MSAEKLALPVRAETPPSGNEATLRDADDIYLGRIVTFGPPIPADIALRAAKAAAAVINRAMTPAWTWERSTCDENRRFYFRGKYRGFAEATDTMAQAMCDGLNAAGVEP